MTSSWKKLQLTELCASSDDMRCGPFGTQLNKDEFRKEGVPLWGIKQVNRNFSIHTHEFLEPETADRLRQYDLRAGDLVMTRKGTVGNCAVYPTSFEPGIMHSDLLRIRVDPKLCYSPFLVHQLHHSQDVTRQLSLISNGAIMPGINVGRLKQLEVSIPPLAEQKRIASILDKADAIRRKLQQSLRLSEDFLRSVFLDMFGNPVVSSKVKTVVKVADAGEVQLGRQRAPKYQSGRHTCPYVRVANVYENRISTKDVLSMDFNPSDFKKYRLEEGDILLNEGQSTELVGRPAMWRNEIPDCCFQNTLVRFKAKKGVVEPYYALFVFLHYLWYGRFASLSSKTSSVAHLGAARFAEMPFPLPNLPSQQKFAKLAEKTYRSQVRLRAQVSEAEALFSSLQQRAFRGEL
jgi:type I restriction enzyme S subunit